MKKSNWVMFVALVFLIVSLSCSVVSTSIPTASVPSPIPPPAFTSEPTATSAPIASPTLEPTLEPTQEPTAVPTPTFVLLPQQWNGTYTYNTTGEKQYISLLIEKMKETTFSGKMIWQSFGSSKGAILKMNGEYISDFGDQVEQVKWNNLEDYKNGETGGSWLKWTETEVISGGNYTTNGWYYAHIREDGTMVAVYFFNNTETVADSGSFIFKLVP